MTWILLLLSCADVVTEPCPDGASSPLPVEGTLDGSDACGTFALAVGEHAYLNVFVTEEEAECTGTVSGALIIPYEPIYSNLSDVGPKWTFDVQGDAPGSGVLEVDCVEGSGWVGFFEVETGD